MKREAKLLLNKSLDSLLLGTEIFNRPQERGRVSGTLIQFDHSIEMLLKSAIVHKGGRIREDNAGETIGFDACVRKAVSDNSIRFLSEEQALTLQCVNALRNAAQHYLLDICEGQLYIHVQSSVTLFRDLLSSVFQQDLTNEMPTRVLPISTSPVVDLVPLFDSEIGEILKLLQPGRRRKLDAEARLRPLAVLDATIQGEKRQPSNRELHLIGEKLKGTDWKEIFTGASAISIDTEGSGISLSLRITKNEGPPFQLVPEGTPGAYTVGVKRVNELDFYNLGARDLAIKLDLTVPKLHAVVERLAIRENPDYFKEFKIGSISHRRYSQRAIKRLQSALDEKAADIYWQEYKAMRSVDS